MFNHIQVKEPERHLIEPPAKVCLKLTGGIGDVLIALGGGAKKLTEMGYEVTAAVRDYQLELISEMVGVSHVIRIPRLNDPQERAKFDVLINFEGTFNNTRYLKTGGYYKLASERLGVDFGPGRFKFNITERYGYKTVAIHAGASNPNRRWSGEKFRELAYELVRRGLRVIWLGTSEELNFEDAANNIYSTRSESLHNQVSRILTNCDYFIGNDSSFAHAAGILRIPGMIIFSASHPLDVIDQYPSLWGIYRDENPSRSLRPDDEQSLQALEELAVEKVLMGTPFYAINCTGKIVPNKEAQEKPIILIHENVEGSFYESMVEQLDKWYKRESINTISYVGSDITIQLFCRDGFLIASYKGKEYTLKVSHVEDLRRAIREILSGT